MDFSYDIHFEDFAAGWALFRQRAGRNPGFVCALIACLTIALVGLDAWRRGLGVELAIFCVGLGVVGGGAAYFLDAHSIRQAKRKREETIAAAYQQLHCREDRTFHADEQGMTFRCRCGAVTRPWSELREFAENESRFILATNSDVQGIPRSAFATEAEATEFRREISSRLQQNRSHNLRHIEFACTPGDYRHAWLLHTVRGGGWRGLLRTAATFTCVGFGLFTLSRSLPGPMSALVWVCGIATPLLVRLSQNRRRKPYLGHLRIYFGEDGLHLEDRQSVARTAWTQFVGYLEDKRLLLLYYNPRLYRIVPKADTTGTSWTELLALVPHKLSKFDYRQPLRHMGPATIPAPR